jgi:hypothetical protein
MHVIRRLLREPLLHFLLIGAALFVLYGPLNRGQSDAPREIVISEARVAAIAENFATVWMRPPTAEELKGLIDDYVAEEVYYREAIAMGLDQDDTVIRRRLRQKMEFISDGIADSVEPTDAQLQSFLEQNAAKFAQPAGLPRRRHARDIHRDREPASLRAQHARLALARVDVPRGPERRLRRCVVAEVAAHPRRRIVGQVHDQHARVGHVLDLDVQAVQFGTDVDRVGLGLRGGRLCAECQQRRGQGVQHGASSGGFGRHRSHLRVTMKSR